LKKDKIKLKAGNEKTKKREGGDREITMKELPELKLAE